MNDSVKKAPVSTVTVNRDEVIKPTNNIYMAIVIISKRAEQIQAEMKEELKERLKDFADIQDTLQEIIENQEVIDVSKYYEQLPKPWAIALQEWLEGKIKWEFANEQDSRQNIF